MDSQESPQIHHSPQHHIQSLLAPHHQCQQPLPHSHEKMAPTPAPTPTPPPQPYQPDQPNSYVLPNNNNDFTRAKVIFHQPQQQNHQFSLNSISGQNQKFNLEHSGRSTAVGSSVEPVKKKRGRPRKYSADANVGLGLFPIPVAQIPSIVNPPDPGVGGIGATTSSKKPSEKGRERPMGSEKQKQRETLGATGFGAMPHVIKVGIGEDIAAKIMTFSQQGKRAVYILSAFGIVCNATIQQPAVVGGTVTYEGQFRIVSLSGSFLPSESNDSHSKTGGMIVSLAGLESSIISGVVVGKLVAGSPVQVVLSSFVKPMSEGPSLTPPPNIGAPVTEASSPLAGGRPSSNAAPPMHDVPGQTM